ncbi:hypothetical protein ACFL0Q_03930 [Thermodesulfobacteriota bacterium]
MDSPRKGDRLLLAGLFCLWLVAVLAGCSGQYGMLTRSLDVKYIFENNKVLSDYRYYYTGPEASPSAIVGIQKDHALVTGIWREVDLTPAQLKNWIYGMSGFSPIPSPYLVGSAILDPEGKQVGVWYSREVSTTVRFEPSGHIIVHPPITGDSERRRGLLIR